MDGPTVIDFTGPSNSELCCETTLRVTQYKCGANPNLSASQVSLPLLRLTKHYDFKCSYQNISECSSRTMIADELRLIVHLPLSLLLSSYSYISLEQLKEICLDHKITPPKPVRKQTLLDKMHNHSCGDRCRDAIYEFVVRSKERQFPVTHGERVHGLSMDLSTRARPADEAPEPVEGDIGDSDTRHLEIADDELRRAIISEWETVMGTKAHLRYICACCSRKTAENKIFRKRASKARLDLLRNDELPEKVWPTTYNFEAYGRALLNPKGLTDINRPGELILCESCNRSLNKGEMPKFSLANWLYFGYEELPADVRDAFDQSTRVDRVLISRARTTRICFRYSDKPNHPAAKDPISSQKYNQGNVMVMPQDSAELQKILPPSPSELCDTVCAVFVGQEKPTRANISRMHPMLVRKSRVKTMIGHLVEHNEHYEKVEGFKGFDEQRLEELFSKEDSDKDEAVPFCMEIGHVPLGEGIDGATADYTPRNQSLSNTTGEILMENVGFTSGDESPESYVDMKAAALKHCLNGNLFVSSGSGNRYVPDFDNPSLLSWAFPHLDPWGIAGFHHSKRKIKLSMDEQLSHMLQLDDSRFEKDSDFAFVYYNIRQKKTVYENIRYKVPAYRHQDIIGELLKVDPDLLESLQSKFKSDPMYQPQTEKEKNIVRLLAKINLVGTKIPGSAGYKLNLRNEIRAMINFRGAPTLFVTLNPADVDNPIVRILGGEDIVIEDVLRGEDMDEHRRKIFAAKHPAACAQFFHSMISSFINVILKPSKKPGLFGKCSAYYGTVEAQGKGTLHCHMLIWLDGHPSPQVLRDRMETSEEYKMKMFRWLESVIKNELPSDTSIVPEPDGKPLRRPKRAETTGDPDPGVIAPPALDGQSTDDFASEFESFVEALVKEYNWHEHSSTCWKYLRKGDKEVDANCRMRMDGVTREATNLDPETCSILLRRLHPRIASYNDLVIFCMRSNMDIKFIGSGEAAKALVYYITDYITKASLPTHVGIAALSYAIRRTNVRFPGMLSGDLKEHSQSALTITVNSMMGKQEISHQQVMSYLVGGGDHYSSDTFSLLYMTAFSKLIGNDVSDENDLSIHSETNNSGSGEETGVDIEMPDRIQEPGDDSGATAAGHEPNVDGESVEDMVTQPESGDQEISVSVVEDDPERLPASDNQEEQHDRETNQDEIVLSLERGTITASGQQYDYIYRSTDPEFDKLALYDFVSKVKRCKQERAFVDTHNEYDSEPEYAGPGKFSSKRHPQFDTHRLRIRQKYCIPVILGPKIPRRSTSAASEQKWARAICILFKPWRKASDLKRADQTWLQAYLEFEPRLSKRDREIIKNMDVLTECKEARNEFSKGIQRDRLREMGSIVQDMMDDAIFNDGEAGNGAVYDGFDDSREGADSVATQAHRPSLPDAILGGECVSVLDAYFKGDVHAANPPVPSASGGDDSIPHSIIKGHLGLMKGLKRKRRPDFYDGPADARPQKRKKIKDKKPEVQVMTVDEDEGEMRYKPPSPQSFFDVVESIVEDFNLSGNPEQERAFRLVADNVSKGWGSEQLMMYVGGVGGTGKSHVIKSIVELFVRLGRRHEVLVGAPTGIASILIEGHTVHALLNLPDKNKTRLKDLRALWKPVLYFIVDEVSMISARFLSEISSRLKHAKGDDMLNCDKPFGGVNVIFTGDFGQLKPVKASALYRHELVNSPKFAQCKDTDAVSTLNGAFLWRQVNEVVILKKNKRQETDAEYAALLNRVRNGKCHTTVVEDRSGHVSGKLSDLDILRSRQLSTLALKSGPELKKFADAPFIVGTRRIRDAINAKMITHHASRTGQKVNLYHAQDFISSQPVTGLLKQKLLNVSSTITEDALGKLPLFEGMKVMVTSNLAVGNRIVNGSEATVHKVVYSTDDDDVRYIKVVYVRMAGIGKLDDTLEEDIVPIFPERESFKIKIIDASKEEPCYRYVARVQVPLVPAYAYTDYKSQGRSLKYAIIDLTSVRSLQGAYVMLSRVHSLDGVAILRWFPASKIHQRPPQDLREEFLRLDHMAVDTGLRARQREANKDAMLP